MKKLISLFILSSIVFISCSSVFSPIADKTVKVDTKCDNCYTNNKFYRGYGKSEAEAGVDAELVVRAEAQKIARDYISKDIETHVMIVAAQVFEKKSDGKDSNIRNTFVESSKQQIHAMLNNSYVICTETEVSKKGSYVIATACVELSKKDLNDELYRSNKEMFSQAEIDYDTFQIRLSAQLKDK